MMELTDMSISARTVFGGFKSFEATTGQTVKIKSSPQGVDVISELVPEGERWQVTVNIQIEKFTV